MKPKRIHQTPKSWLLNKLKSIELQQTKRIIAKTTQPTEPYIPNPHLQLWHDDFHPIQPSHLKDINIPLGVQFPVDDPRRSNPTTKTAITKG